MNQLFPTLRAMRASARTRARILATVALLGAAAAQAGCVDPAPTDQPAPPGPGPEAPAGPDSGTPPTAGTPTPQLPPDEGQPPPAADTAEWTAAVIHVERSVSGVALLRDVRTAAHDGFDRIVLDFGDSGVPSWHIEYVDRPVRQCGSGAVVELAGDAWLSIRVDPADAHTPDGRATVQDRHRRPGLPVLEELRLVCDFEAHVEWVAGVATPGRVRAFLLDSPDRLVVDIATR